MLQDHCVVNVIYIFIRTLCFSVTYSRFVIEF